tara:strand:+ start:289 stop:927 length:639 start_codon:yes stop_codon:yes gene_type:complete
MTGWVSIYRKLYDHEAFDNHLEASVFAYLIVKACYKPARLFYRNRTVDLQRGEVCITQRDLAKGFQLSRTRIRGILSRLESLGMIRTKLTHQLSVISICNYSRFQGMRNTKKPQDNQQNNNTINNNNNDFNVSDFINVKMKNPNYILAVDQIKKGVRRTKKDQKLYEDFLARMSDKQRADYFRGQWNGESVDFDETLKQIRQTRYKASTKKQ